MSTAWRHSVMAEVAERHPTLNYFPCKDAPQSMNFSDQPDSVTPQAETSLQEALSAFRPGVEMSGSLQSKVHSTDDGPGQVMSVAAPTTNKRVAPKRASKSANALPAFSFNPGVSTKTNDSPVTPPRSPRSTSSTIPRLACPSQTASESMAEAGSGETCEIRSTSPNREGAEISSRTTSAQNELLATPRGHRHRRSGAISSQDLTAARREANSDSPSKIAFEHNRPGTLVTPSWGFLTSTSVPQGVSSSEPLECSMPPRPSSRSRVGFSDTLEFIPSPMSFASSGTDVSPSTALGHRSLDSVSSHLSGGTGSPTTRSLNSSVPVVSCETFDPPRPSSAGPSLEHERRLSDSSTLPTVNLERPFSSSYHRRSPTLAELNRHTQPKLWSPAPVSELVADSTQKVRLSNQESFPQHFLDDHGLAGDYADSTVVGLNEDFDNDPTATIISAVSTSKLPDNQLYPTMSYRSERTGSSYENDTSSPIIDLDLALQTSDPLHVRGRNFNSARRSMHSSGLTSGFFKPAAPRHRRTESAPHVLSPHADRAPPWRLADCSPSGKDFEISDVFEEDEEEQTEAGIDVVPAQSKRSAKEQAQGLGLGLEFKSVMQEKHYAGRVAQSPHLGTAEEQRPVAESSNNTRIESSFSPITKSPLATAMRRFDSVEIYDEDHNYGQTSIAGSAASTTTSELVSDVSKGDARLEGLPYLVPRPPFLVDDGTTMSSFSTPQSGLTDTSFSTPRPETDFASFTDSRQVSLGSLVGTAPELRASVDDLPSLVSSRSTRTSAVQPRLPSSSSRIGDGHASSGSLLSEPSAVEGRRKRASIASLSRLVSGSFSDSSKLSLDQATANQGKGETQAVRERKGRRMGNLLKFWKRKESNC